MTRWCIARAIRAGARWRNSIEWLRPKIAVPAHGEALHLQVHADFARQMGVEHVLAAHNGDMISLGPDAPGASAGHRPWKALSATAK